MRPSLRLVRGGVDARYHSVTATPEALADDLPAMGESPDQPGGDDGTRTHDPLLANKPSQDVCGHLRTRVA